tara:strand:- start:6224 stop:7519 length:1296 start_codon:yes stop_codon:yes gene_type:complete
MTLLTGSEQGYYDGGDFGGYQFTSLGDIINNFMATYIGEDRILPTTRRSDVTFHAMRAMQELSFDTFKSCKTQEIEVAPHLTMPLPRDYVNYVKLSWSDASGIEHVIYPTSKTSNPRALNQDANGDYNLTAVGTMVQNTASITLDSEYANVWVGMIVVSPSIPTGTTVIATSTVSGVTTITTSSNTTYTGTETLTFTAPNGNLLEQSTSLVLSGLSWVALDNKIIAATSVGAAAVGMIVSHEDFPVGTEIIDINGLVITTSANSTALATAENANFVSYTGVSDTWSKYKSATPPENDNDDYQDDNYWPMNGQRYGLDPQHAQVNGSYFIDCATGKIHFSSNLAGKTVILEYISDGLGTYEEMIVHKFAEEAMYKWIMYGCLSARIDIPEYVIRRYKKERFAETRKAKLRLSNIKLEEITQILRGKSKQIKH